MTSPNHDAAPDSSHSERALLGLLMIEPEGIAAVRELVSPADLWRDRHRHLYRVLLEMDAEGRRIDLTTVIHRIQEREDPLLFGDYQYVLKLGDDVPPAAALPQVANEVREYARRRTLLRLSRDLAELARADDIEEAERTAATLMGGLGARAATRAPFADEWVTVGAEWLVTPPPAREYLLRAADTDDGVLPRGIVALLAAAGSTGKSYFLTALALAVAAGSEACGLRAQRGRVLLVLGEESPDEARRRVYAQAGAMGIAVEQIADRLVVWAAAGKSLVLTNEGGRETVFARDVRARLASEPYGEWAMIALDPLSRFGALDVETDNAAATRLVEVFESFAQVAGRPTVVVSAHTSKASRTAEGTPDPRGSSAIWDGVRHVWAMAKPHDADGQPIDEYADLWTTKTNYTRAQPRTLLARNCDGSLRLATTEERESIPRKSKGKSKSNGKGTKSEGMGQEPTSRPRYTPPSVTP